MRKKLRNRDNRVFDEYKLGQGLSKSFNYFLDLHVNE